MVCEDDNTLISPPEGDIRNDDITFVDASTQPLLLSQVVTIELADRAGADGLITCSGRVNLSPVEAPEWEYYTKTSGTCDDDAQGQLIATKEECLDAGGTADGSWCCEFDGAAPTGCTLPPCGCDIMRGGTQCLQFPDCSEDAPCLCKRPKSDWEYYEKTSGRCTDDGELIPYEAECRANGGTANGNGFEFAWLAEFGSTSPPSGCTSPAMTLTLPIAECLQFPDCSEDLPCICRRLESERRLQAEKNFGQFFLTVKISSSAASTSIGILSVVMGSIVAVYAV